MSNLVDPIAALTDAIAERQIVLGHRMIADGDEGALLPDEASLFQTAVLKVRRQSGAARIAARKLLDQFNFPDVAILKTPSGAPVWPCGVVGSMAHDDQVAVAAIARASAFASVGIDIEPAQSLPDELVDYVTTQAEQSRYCKSVLHSRALFVAKEAVYKAVHPLDGVFLEPQDIDVDLERQIALVSYGRSVPVRVKASSHVIGLAFIKKLASSAAESQLRTEIGSDGI